MPRWLRALIGGVIVFAVVAFLLWICWGWIAYWLFGASLDTAISSAAPAREFSMGIPLPQAPPAPRDAPPSPAPAPEAKKEAPPPPSDTKHALPRPMVVWGASTMAGMLPAAAQPAKVAGGDEDDSGSTGTAKDSAYGKDLVATRIANARPKLHRFPPRYTIKKGTTFLCTPPMPIDTQLPGPLWCTVNEDVYSMDGTAILIPKGSTANAIIEHGLGLGQDRAVLVFTDILTTGPDFLPIPLDASTGASELGQNGVPVDVNEHTWQKLKTTLMFAGIEFLTSAGTAALQSNKGNTQYNFGTMSNVPQSLAAIAFQHDMQIPTTGYRGPGKPIMVYVNQYIDLSDYYTVAIPRGR